MLQKAIELELKWIELEAYYAELAFKVNYFEDQITHPLEEYYSADVTLLSLGCNSHLKAIHKFVNTLLKGSQVCNNFYNTSLKHYHFWKYDHQSWITFYDNIIKNYYYRHERL
jgi:hypothetical protein